MTTTTTPPREREQRMEQPPRGDELTWLGRSEAWLIRRLLRRLGDPPVRVTLPGGAVIDPVGKTAAVGLTIHDRAALGSLAWDAELQFGELYSEGRLTVEGDLLELICVLNRSMFKAGVGVRDKPGRREYSKSVSSLRNARKNIHEHYDLGNDFYQLWLDDKMVYTCAYFPTPDATLEEAQFAKLDLVCRKLRLKPGDRVVEAGCGWGALAMHMAEHYGVTVRAFNISHEQVVWAREQAQARGLQERVEFVEDDYRNITGEYDVFASVGMLEHVGLAHYAELGAVINRVLTPDGRGLVHSIGRNAPRVTNRWITTRIFPQGYTPAISEIMQIFEPYELSVLDIENIRLHYARTLHFWRQRFEDQAELVRDRFDERFVRMWRLYLVGSQAAFMTGAMQLFQVVFTRQLNNRIPLTRDFLYQPEAVGVPTEAAELLAPHRTREEATV